MTRLFAALLLSVSLLLSAPATAEDSSALPQPPIASATDVVPPQTVATTPDTAAALPGELPAAGFPILRLTPDKIDVVKLETDAVNVIVGNAAHLLAVMETPRQVLLVPRAPGATHFQVLDAHGKTIMERSIIVAAPKQDYIRVRRACATKDGGECLEYSIYYCPDMCHAVQVTQDAKQSGAEVPDESASGGSATTGTPAGETINDQPVSGDAYSNAASAGRQMLGTP